MTAAANPALEEDPADNGKITPIDVSLAAEASSAHARINVAINLANWRSRPNEEQEDLLWFHQHLLDEQLSWLDACKTINLDRSTIFRLLKGTYEAQSWAGPIGAIRSYRKIIEARASIQQQTFAPNPVSRLIWAGLDYALANQSITTIIGESRQGKTISIDAWAAANNHGRSVKITAPPWGGVRALVRAVIERIGGDKATNTEAMIAKVYRGFNANRILIVDEAHRLLPRDGRSTMPQGLEILRDIHDRTGCALAFVATARFSEKLRSGAYQFEQLIGRIGMPIRIPVTLGENDVLPILHQFLPHPSKRLIASLVAIANKPGRLGIVVETLRVASRIAKKAAQPLDETHIAAAIKFRDQMTGGAE